MDVVDCEIGLTDDGMDEDDGIQVTCLRCGHSVGSGGTGITNVRRCLSRLRSECPEEQNNFYRVSQAEKESNDPFLANPATTVRLRQIIVALENS